MVDKFILILSPFFILLVSFSAETHQSSRHLNLTVVTDWAFRIEVELKNVADFVTRRARAKQAFSHATLEKRADEKTGEEITDAIKSMMKMKVEAVKRIMEVAENASEDAKDEEVKNTYTYYNAKCLVPMDPAEESCSNQTLIADLTSNAHFWGIPVNTGFSAVHVPTNVFDRARDVLKPIKWSQLLDLTFKANYENDPSLTWQYFGSSTGIMRHYPALEWKYTKVDLYDCRTRSWYIEAASSPKDMVILVDQSGSMTGERKEIAKHVVDDILDTLGNNDYVSIMGFNDETREVEPCFENKLVQANLVNIRHFKEKLPDLTTTGVANFSQALERAFTLLEQYRNDDNFEELEERRYDGANCNQAIMLVTDGVPYNYKEVFDYYNWQNNITVRLFTYLVGREVADIREIRWMACANRGYYVHVSTLAEVREQVLKYVPVMARPLVLTKTNHPVIWTPVYADVTDPKMTDYIWEKKENAVQKNEFHLCKARDNEAKRNGILKERKRDSHDVIEKKKIAQDVDPSIRQEYKLMTSVSVPVFDKRDNANITETVLLNEAVWVERTRETRIAALLGVAGTDVPIAEIKKLMNPFKLGVGGYAFVVTNNGYILYHPDLRAEFNGILRPNYNSVEFVEIEIADDNREPREFNHTLLELRERLISHEAVKMRPEVLDTKYHMDNLKRVALMRKKYYYWPIFESPFTVVIAVPHNYGNYRVSGTEELRRLVLNNNGGKESLGAWFAGRKWRIHPDWVYCKYVNESYGNWTTPEEEICHFLGRGIKPGWKWQSARDHHHAPNSSTGKPSLAKDAYYCERDLMLSVLFDAHATEWFNLDFNSTGSSNLKQWKTRFGLTVAFIATRSGLTRWKNIAPVDSNSDENSFEFGDLYPRAIDETWYKRAVDHHYVDPDGYVYSVPYDAGPGNDTVVTVSHAIFVKKMDNEAPAAVVGYQFHLDALRNLLFNVTSTCPNCDTLCTSHDLECYIIDNNGYVVVSENKNTTGVFFGKLEINVMTNLVRANIFRKIRFYDYQAVCFPIKGEPVYDCASLTKPFSMIATMTQWFIGRLLWLATNFGFTHVKSDFSSATDFLSSYIDRTEDDALDSVGVSHNVTTDENITYPLGYHCPINKTRPESCDQEMNRYILQYDVLNETAKKYTGDCPDPFVVRHLESTNLILVVVNRLCPPVYWDDSDEPKEVSNGPDSSYICHKYITNNLYRRRPKDCIWHHEKEKEIVDSCGRGSAITLTKLLLSLTIISFFWCQRC